MVAAGVEREAVQCHGPYLGTGGLRNVEMHIDVQGHSLSVPHIYITSAHKIAILTSASLVSVGHQIIKLGSVCITNQMC